jgi:radical SAM protein with 4Fe4S-binding SPASM domain
MTRSVIRSREDRERWESVLLPLGWTPEFRGWMILPESAENPSDRELVRQNGSCFFMADAEEFSDNPWRGEVNLLYVDTDGNVVPCCYHPKAHVFGNLKQQSYNEILNGDVRKAFKARQETDRQSLSICSQCEVGPVGSEGPSFHTVMKL